MPPKLDLCPVPLLWWICEAEMLQAWD